MGRLLNRILDIGADPTDDADLRVRKRTAVATSLALELAGFFYLVVGMVGDRPAIAIPAALQMAGQALNLVAFSRFRRLTPIVITIVALGMATVASGVVALGGLNHASANAVWGLLAPIGAVLLIGARAAVPAYLVLVALVIGAAILDPYIPTVPDLPVAVALGLTAVNLLAPAALALGLVVYIDGQRLRARRESDALLLNVLPRAIADRLKAGERVIADHYDAATVLFADVVDFTPFAEGRAPAEVVAVLNELFTGFDRLAEERGLEKIKTIGDAYMVVAGVPQSRDDHAGVMVEMALAMHALVRGMPAIGGHVLQIRTGIASGPLMAGVIGERKFSYDLWGDTVNTASRMESSGVPGCIQVTERTCALLAGRYPFERRDGVEVKGKGPMTTWLLDPTRAGVPAT